MRHYVGQGFTPAVIVACLLALTSGIIARQAAPRAPHIVFVTGDDEYRSEITMPMIAAILEKSHGFKTPIAYAKPKPQTKDNIEGLDVLDRPRICS